MPLEISQLGTAIALIQRSTEEAEHGGGVLDLKNKSSLHL
jgi:hypothetical protein